KAEAPKISSQDAASGKERSLSRVERFRPRRCRGWLLTRGSRLSGVAALAPGFWAKCAEERCERTRVARVASTRVRLLGPEGRSSTHGSVREKGSLLASGCAV